MKEVVFPPKPCFGKYHHKECINHHDCEQSGECNMWTNYFKGACNCPYKKSCHEPRQRLQADIRKETGYSDIRKCDFYKYFI